MTYCHYLSCLLLTGPVLPASGQVDLSPNRTVVVPVAPKWTGDSLPLAAGNHLLQYRTYSQDPATSKIRLINLDNQVERVLDPWPADPTEAVYIKKVHPLPDGRVYVGLRAISVGNQRAEVMAIYNAAGKLTHSFRTNPFAWNDFAVDKDNSIWVFGSCPDYLAAQCGSDYSTVRHYSPDGREVGSFLPFYSFPSDPFLAPRITVANTFIFNPSGRIAIYAAGTEELIQFDRQGKLLSREKLNFGDDVHVVRLMMTPEGRLFLALDYSIREWNARTKVFDEHSYLKGGRLSALEKDQAVLVSYRIGESTSIKYFSLQNRQAGK